MEHNLFLQTNYTIITDFVLLEDNISISSTYHAVDYIKNSFILPPDIVTWMTIELQVTKNLYNKEKNKCWWSKPKIFFNLVKVTIDIIVVTVD